MDDLTREFHHLVFYVHPSACNDTYTKRALTRITTTTMALERHSTALRCLVREITDTL